MRSKLIVAALLLASVTSAQAQWNTMPQYNIGASRGPSVSTPQAIAPGTTGRPMTSQGAAAYPAFSATLSNMTSINGVNVPSAGSFFATTTGTETLTNKSMAGSANTFTVIPNSALVNSATTVNGQTCTLGSTCTISASAGSITVGVTTIASGTSGRLLTNSSGVLGDIATSGSGNVALTTSPVFTTPNLGTPSAVVLTNGTGLLISGISGLGTGVATFLGTPSSANLAASLTDETGTGAAVFGTSPTITSPSLVGQSIVQTWVDAGSGGGPTYEHFRDSASPASLDGLGSDDFTGRNSATTKFLYARLSTLILNATAGSEQSQYTMLSANGAGGYDVNNFGSGIQAGSASGGFPGNGNIAAQGWFACSPPVTKTGTTGTVGASDCSIIFNASGTFTATLPSPTGGNTGRVMHVKSIAAQAINSASSNVVPRTTATAGTALLASGAGNWATLQSDGTNWVVMAGN